MCPTPPPAVARAVAPVGLGWRHPHHAQLLRERPSLDFLEVHSENFFGEGGAALATLLAGREHYPVSLHGVGLSLGSADGLDLWHLQQLARLVERVAPLRVSDHASFARLNGATPRHAADLLPVPFTRAALQAMCDNVSQAQDALRRPIAVENLSAYIDWQAQDLAEPEFLRELARRTGCALLVDVNNLLVNALNAQGAPEPGSPGEARAVAQCRAWLDAVAGAAVAELHVAGHCRVDDAAGCIVIDDHGSPVRAPVWSLLAHAWQCLGPVPTLVEWDTDLPALDVLLDEVRSARALAATAPGQPQAQAA